MNPALNIEALRSDTPGCENVLHFNNAGAGLMPRPVLVAVTEHLEREAMIGGYEAAAEARERTQATYEALGTLLRARPDHIALMENATKAWDTVFYGVDWCAGDRVLTAQASYASNYLAMLQLRERIGIEIDVAPNDAWGQVDIGALERLITPRTRLVCLTHIPTNSGLVNPAAAVGDITRRHGIPYLLDACQSVGQVDVDMEEIGCDFLSGTGRKYLRGPRGTGFLAVRSGSLEKIHPPVLDLHAARWAAVDRYELQPDARRFETWEGYVAGKIGLGVAVRYALNMGMPAIASRTAEVAARLRTSLETVPGISIHDIGQRKGGIVTFSHIATAATDIQRRLATRAMNTNIADPDWARLDAERRKLPGMVRASVHCYNTEEEVDQFTEAVAEITST